MNQAGLQDIAWYQAITLTERITSLRATQRQAAQDQINAELAERRLQRWRSQTPFTGDGYFEQRLEMDHLSEDEFRYLLGEPVEAVRERCPAPPAWLARLEEAFARSPLSEPMPLPEALRDQKMAGFLNLIKPLILQARERVCDEVQALLQAHPDSPLDPDTGAEVLFANLPGRLMFMLSRTLVLELRVAGLQGLLEGESPEERFQSFVKRLRQREVAQAILQEYPVLARQLVIWTEQWLNFSLEFLRHLCADWDAIRATFNPGGDPGLLVEVNGGAGDRHRDGRAVMIARFDSGFQVVYKPKSLAVEAHFQELLTWLNERGDHPPFRTFRILDCETYGWIEFVTAQGCTSAKEIARFYERQGGYLALLHALEATDFHYENLIAAGECPVLVDLESLFHPRVGDIDTRQSDLLAGNTLAHSVMRVGLLPQRIWASDESEGVEISGLGMSPGQLTPQGVPQWDGAGTDEMQFTRRRMEMPGSQNRPSLNGTDVNVLDYAETIVAGFTSVYRLFLKHRAELLADDGPLARFAEDDVRAILRPTRTYGLLLQESFHPDLLRDALDCERLFDRLWVGIENQPHLSKVIPAERTDLWRNDVPLFTTRPNSRHLWSSMGERIADFFDEPGMDLALRRVQQMSEEDLAQQTWFINASLTALALGEEQAHKPARRLTNPQAINERTPAQRKSLLAAARAAGDRLESLALHGEHDVSWLGVTLINESHWSLLPLGPDLYGGLPGVALFLAYLGAITQQERYTALAQGAVATLRRQIERGQSFIPSIGGYSGWGGVIYTLAHLGVLWEQADLLDEAEGIVEQLPALIEQDEVLDVLGGAAGCIGGLLSLYHCAPSERTLAAAIQCGERLLACAQSMEQGIGWTTRIAESKPLAGFSHGAAGMAWALLELASLTGETRFQSAALGAITYERSLFSPAAGNWLDLREYEVDNGQEQERFMTAWCHGAPGIGLARLRALKHLDDVEVRAEIDTALKTTLVEGFGGNHSLCHGAMGNLELLFQASQTLDDSQLRHHVYRIAAAILESIDEHGWVCGIALGTETPGPDGRAGGHWL